MDTPTDRVAILRQEVADFKERVAALSPEDWELASMLLQEVREAEDIELAEEQSKQEELARETYLEAMNDAVIPIADWIKATIEVFGGPLVLDAPYSM